MRPGRGALAMRRSMARSSLAVLALAGLLAACAPKRFELPSGDGEPFPDYAAAFTAASAGCRDLRTLTAELSVSGKIGHRKMRGRVIAGFERPSRMRLEAVAPAGPPVFVLVADAGSATLVMPRADQVLKGAAPDSVLEALVGVSLGPDDLVAALSGCVAPNPVAAGGHRFPGGWVRVDLAGDSAAYLKLEGSAWQIVAGVRPLFEVEYERATAGPAVPRTVRLRAVSNGGPGADLVLGLGQVEVDAPVAAKAFTVTIPRSAVPITLADLKQEGPLGEGR